MLPAGHLGRSPGGSPLDGSPGKPLGDSRGKGADSWGQRGCFVSGNVGGALGSYAVRPSSTPLAPTGERTAPGLEHEGYWFARHEAAYAWIAGALDLAGAVVVDAGSGEGYGARMLAASGARACLALEYDEAACLHAATAYPQIASVRANLAALPLRDAIADVLVSLQVVEHLWSLPEFLAQCRRVLRPGGVLVVTTPNRLTFSPGLARGEKPLNPFHVEEFDADQVRSMLVSAGFADVDVLGLHHGARIREWEARHGSLVQAQVDAVLSGEWPAHVDDMVSSVTVADFAIARDDVHASCDLVGIARAAS